MFVLWAGVQIEKADGKEEHAGGRVSHVDGHAGSTNIGHVGRKWSNFLNDV